MQFMMLNLKKLFLEAERKSKIENFIYFEKHLVFRKNDDPLVFRIFRAERKIH
jgi:hypothetical protein